MLYDWFDLPPSALALLFFVFVALTLGGVALRRLSTRKREALRAYGAGEDASLQSPSAEPASPTAPLTSSVPQAPTPDLAREARRQEFARGLHKTHASLWHRLAEVFRVHPHSSSEMLEAIEEVLLTADVGVRMTTKLTDDLALALKTGQLKGEEDLREALRLRLEETFRLAASSDKADVSTVEEGPRVILFVGVNGVGKTTSIGKLASRLVQDGHKVMLAAGDTFRAAAAEQLELWGERSGAEVVRGEANADPASVMFSALEAAKKAGCDYLLADTAGRLHTKVELMDEIQKVRRALGKVMPGAPHDTWLVVDATTGQNALQQAREFHQALGLTGLILTKLDGTAKGGVVIAIAEDLKLPVRYVGLGEKAADLMHFEPDFFVGALLAPAA